MVVLDDVIAAVERLFDGRAIRWPDEVDIHAELVSVVMLASPPTGSRVVETLRVLVEGADSLGELVDGLDVMAIRFGQDGDGETCGALLELGDRIREWRDRG
jgi:hypothetical protein